MSKKVLGFTSRKWAAFWAGVALGVVFGGLAACCPPVDFFKKSGGGFKKSEPLNGKARAPERESQSRGFESIRVD